MKAFSETVSVPYSYQRDIPPFSSRIQTSPDFDARVQRVLDFLRDKGYDIEIKEVRYFVRKMEGKPASLRELVREVKKDVESI